MMSPVERKYVNEQVQLQLRRLTELHPDPLTAAVLLLSGLTEEELEEAGGMPKGDTLELRTRMTPANQQRSRLAAQDAIYESMVDGSAYRDASGLQADEDDPWDDASNPLGCCADHRPGGPGTRQQHGGPGCRWPG